MHFRSYRLLIAAAAISILLVPTAASAQTACTVCLSPSGEIYDGRATPYSAVPPPQPRSTYVSPPPAANSTDYSALIQLLLLQQQLEQQAQQLPPQQPAVKPAPMPLPVVSANDRYSTSQGVMTSNQMQSELLAVGYSGPFDVPSLLAAYQRTTNSPVRPI